MGGGYGPEDGEVKSSMEDAFSSEVLAAASIAATKLADADAEVVDVVIEITEQDVQVAMLRTRLLQREHFEEGLEPFRSASGEEIPAMESPMLNQLSMRRFLHQSKWDIDAAFEAIVGTLSWRRRIFPSEKESTAVTSCRAATLLEEGVRFRRLGRNRDGDFVVALNFLWGHFVTADATALDLVRMIYLGVEAVLQEADDAGHPRLVLMSFGGPPPCSLANVISKSLERHYPDRLKHGVIYPIPSVLATLAKGCLYFTSRETRNKFIVATEEEEAVEGARLVGPEQLPEDWRGGVDGVVAHHQPDTSLMNSMVLEYLNPFPGLGSSLESDLEGRWTVAIGSRA